MTPLTETDSKLLRLVGFQKLFPEVVFSGPYAYVVGTSSVNRLTRDEYAQPTNDSYKLTLLSSINSNILLADRKTTLSDLKSSLAHAYRYNFNTSLIKKSMEFIGPTVTYWVNTKTHSLVLFSDDQRRASVVYESLFA